MRVSAKTDYAVRAAAELAAVPPGEPLKAERIADAQTIPLKFLENILAELRHAGLVASRRGPEGGYLLAKPANEVTVADVIRAVDGPLGGVGGEPPEAIEYVGAAAPLKEAWIAARASLRSVLETVTLAHLVNGKLPAAITRKIQDPDTWVRR